MSIPPRRDTQRRRGLWGDENSAFEGLTLDDFMTPLHQPPAAEVPRTFAGIPIAVDPSLSGDRYAIAAGRDTDTLVTFTSLDTGQIGQLDASGISEEIMAQVMQRVSARIDERLMRILTTGQLDDGTPLPPRPEPPKISLDRGKRAIRLFEE